jgi:N4-gp56 family major capsid protein
MTQFRSLARPEPGFGSGKGQTVAIEKWQKMDVSVAPIGEFATLPLQKPAINEVTVTIAEYGNGVSHTLKAKTVAEYMLSEQLQRVVDVNVIETMDTIVGNVFRTADVFWTPLGAVGSETTTSAYDTDGTITQTAVRNISAFDFVHIKANLRKANVPYFDGSMYLAIMNPFGFTALLRDTQAGGIVELHKYNQPEALIRGEVGSYGGFRFVEETNVLSDTIGTSVYNSEVIIVGDDAVVEAMAMPETIKSATWDYDRFIGLAWHTYTGFAKVWNFTTDGQYQILRVWAV